MPDDRVTHALEVAAALNALADEKDAYVAANSGQEGIERVSAEATRLRNAARLHAEAAISMQQTDG